MSLSANRIQAMRLAYGKVRDVPLNSEAHRNIMSMLGRLDRNTQVQIARANIRWLSWAAWSILECQPDRDFPREAHIRDNGWGFMPKHITIPEDF